MTKIIFKEDSRDKIYKNNFGQTILLPDELNLDSTLFDDIQPIGDVKCTCYTTVDCAEDQEKREFDIDDLWQRIPKNQFGADPRDVLKEAVANGLLPKGKTERVKDWKSFWSAKDGVKDVFDNVRSALVMSNSPVFNASYWYQEWLNVPEFGVMPEGKTTLNGHAYSIEGWKQVNGEPMLIIEAWIGRKLYMPRDVFNKVMSGYGMQSWVLSTSEIDSKRQKTILEMIRDACINAILLLKQLILVKNPPVKDTYEEVKDAVKDKPKPNMIEKWARAIAKWEGDITGVNPGNLKYSPLTQSWGAKQGRQAQDGGHFALFNSYDDGFKALCNFLTLGCQDKLKDFHKPAQRLLGGFMRVYAGNPPLGYLKGISTELGVPLDTNISSFL